MPATFTQKVIGGAVLGGLGLKFYALHKYNAWRRGQDPLRQRRGSSFARLGHRQQLQVIYAKRQQLRGFQDAAYGPGATHAPRRQRFTPFHIGHRRRLGF